MAVYFDRLIDKICHFYYRARGFDLEPINTSELPKLLNPSTNSGYTDLYRAISLLKTYTGKSIIDVGCGKGAALLVFSRWPFENIHGIEHSIKPYQALLKNLKILGDNRIFASHGDALRFKDYRSYDYIYLYNPFPNRALLEEFIEVLLSDRKKKLTVIYNNPKWGQAFSSKNFHHIKTIKNKWGTGINIYQLSF